MKEESEELYFEKTSRGKINWMQLLGLSVIEVIKSSSKPLTLDENARDSYFNSVICLDKTLEYFKDHEFENNKKKIAGISEPRDRISTLDEFQEWYGLCCKLIGKCNMLPEESLTMEDEYDDSKSGIFTPTKKSDIQQGA